MGVKKGGKILLFALLYASIIINKEHALTAYRFFGAGNESRTRDLNLGKVALYQLSYSRLGKVRHYKGRFGHVNWKTAPQGKLCTTLFLGCFVASLLAVTERKWASLRAKRSNPVLGLCRGSQGKVSGVSARRALPRSDQQFWYCPWNGPIPQRSFRGHCGGRG